MSHDRYLTAYDEGYSAYERSDGPNDCPHIWYTIEHHAWLAGYRDARTLNTLHERNCDKSATPLRKY